MGQFNLVIALSVLLLSATVAYAAKDPPPGTGVDSSVKANILLSIDNSGSMDWLVDAVIGPSGTPLPNTSKNPYKPFDIAVSGDGSWYLAHGLADHRVLTFRQYNSATNWVRDYGTGFNVHNDDTVPNRIAIDNLNNLYLANCHTGRIHKFNSSGAHVESFETENPYAIDVDSDGTLFITASNSTCDSIDMGPFRWRKLSSSGVELGEWTIGDEGECVGCFPRGISVYDDKVYIVSDHFFNSWRYANKHPGINSYCRRGYPVRVYDKETGDYESTWWAVGGTDIEATENGVYVVGRHADNGGSTSISCGGHVGKYSHDGVFIKRFAPKATPLDFCGDLEAIHEPMGMGSDSAGNIYLTGGGEAPSKSFAKKFDKDGAFIAQVVVSPSRENAIKCVLTRLMQNEEVTSKANFGLEIWSDRPWAGNTKMLIKVDENGAENILPLLCDSSVSSCTAAYDLPFGSQGGTDLFQGLQVAEDYFNNRAPAGFTPGPIDPNQPCQQNFIIVLSDGEGWGSPNSVASRLLSELKIKTFVVGFAVDSDASAVENAYQSLSVAGGTSPFSPLYANDEVGLQNTLLSFIAQTQRSALSYTGTAPTIPSGSGDNIYQSSFTIPRYGQWTGKLTKYALNSNTGDVGSSVWEAGEELNGKTAVDRQIWTSTIGIAAGLNNFATASLSALKALMYDDVTPPTDDEASKLINFVRGQDSYDENKNSQTTDQRDWKLGDIYHSEMAIVGPPKAIDTAKAGDTNTEEYFKLQNGYQAFIDANASRDTIIYVGANDGMLHAFKDSTGEELWGFIPPQVLPKLRLMDSGVEHVTIPIYGVDGSPVVKDIYYGGQWRTVLMAGLGREGYGYFALDVTNPSSPSFLFAFENDPQNEVIRHWASNGTYTQQSYGSVSVDYDYSQVGEALAPPTIFLVSDGGSQKSVAAIGGGLNNTDDKDYGFAVYLIDIADQGKVWRVIDLPDAAGGFNNSHPAQVTAVTADTTSAATYTPRYKGAMLYSADMESKVFKIDKANMGSSGLRDSTQYFDAGGNDVNQRASFNPVTASIDSADKLWIYFGTGNLDRLQLSLSTIQNRIFGIKDTLFPWFDNSHSTNYSRLKDVTDEGATCPGESDKGWYINLGRDEKVSSKIELNKQVLFAPIYKPDTTQPCFPGTSTLAELGYSCGNSLRRTELGAGLITGARIFKDKVYLGVSGIPIADSETEVALDNNFIKKGSIVSGAPIAAAESSSSQEAVLESWRERF
jgi:type IV pilus assembly protein PilY1